MSKIQVDVSWLDKVTANVSEVIVELQQISDQAKAMRVLLDDAMLREKAVRGVHKRWETSLGVCCSECRDMGGSLVSWPCDTIYALGGEKK